MYAVAEVIEENCVANKGCRLCIMYCPEADTILLNQKDPQKKVAMVVEQRCKGCELCVVVCNSARHNAIVMVHR
jgi:pyruvate ferredoxin oxidoreductase delta subunit